MKLDELEKISNEATRFDSRRQALKEAEFIATARNYMPKLVAVAKAAKDMADHEITNELWDALEELEK